MAGSVRRSWLVGIQADGTHPLGNAGTMPCYYIRRDKVRRLAQDFQKVYSHQEVYEITDSQWTQQVCELSPSEFVAHVRRVGTLVV